MRRVEGISVIALGVLVAIACGVVLTFSLIGRQVTIEMMFAILAGLIVLFGMSILRKLAT